MANVNGMIATRSMTTREILSTVGNYPYLQVAKSGPETTNVADVIDIQLGDLLKIDKVSGKLARYAAGDTEDIYAVAACNYNSTVLHNESKKAGAIDVYVAGHIKVQECKMISGANRVAVTELEIQKIRKNGIFLL